jgi:hypothetical protein
MYSNITAAPGHGVYISQLIRYSRVSGLIEITVIIIKTKVLLPQWFHAQVTLDPVHTKRI